MKNIIRIFLLSPLIMVAQQEFNGQVGNSADVEGIHVFNKSFQKYTITDKNGKFSIGARVNDTIILSAIQYQLKTIIVTQKNITNAINYIMLDAQVNELDAVYIKPKLSGDLLADSQRIRTKQQITAKTLGLPNAHVKPPSAPERKLYTATHTGGGLPLESLINAVSGRTKKLKKQIVLYKKEQLENSVYENFEEIMWQDFQIPKSELYNFLYYTSSDTLFSQIVKTNSNIVIYDFLQAKAKKYLNLRNSN